jgi:hypothetical protein
MLLAGYTAKKPGAHLFYYRNDIAFRKLDMDTGYHQSRIVPDPYKESQ